MRHRELTEALAALRPSVPLPPGHTEETIHSFLSGIRPAGAPEAEMQAYCGEDWRRFLYTWGLVKDLTGTCLELGANPYFTTTLIREFTSLKLELANYFSPGRLSSGEQDVEYIDRASGLPARRTEIYRHFNIELDRFPYPDSTFDVVLFCEILEHMQMDPLGALLEIKRVLRPEGTLVLTTPNVSRLENVARMMAGENLYDPYSGYGAYGRHNREYTKHELFLLLQHCGFTITTMFSADVHDNRASGYFPLDQVLDLVRFREPDLGQYIFLSAKSSGEARKKRPSFLFRSYPDAEME